MTKYEIGVYEYSFFQNNEETKNLTLEEMVERTVNQGEWTEVKTGSLEDCKKELEKRYTTVKVGELWTDVAVTVVRNANCKLIKGKTTRTKVTWQE